ncbi:citrate lyase beta subunit [Clostridium tetanomorphum]|uniref:HpcH/HpaI aldolase/citrate lyase family protein n=1 Tax=Clostridium tetanomorphum TaxID=1553 RepID=A0A923EA18_CLOTT|nr:HpcH/HpaI aldolase/citrate lyase family protein [Clostridium tetanomorphum]KAJ50121.1 ATP/GTP-binding protein [Clostridium tetanomorphum DSM 665]MBC2399210.1 HpcH/HpaI aldolase/citrate lyase family protein [Clostridium tetanomorphum]MBP1862866.1 citrate lyase beta subunit [Clostridium tetanomorphum]NRS87003.1 citrate lyase beta subunit [Clostridium tetanomorphum]NRZ99212.1 citrate lyase beta subunit [Clostridium tetanomorphum]
MRYFNFVENNDELFFKKPISYGLYSSKKILSHAVGAALYMGGTRKNLLKDILSTTACTVVICLEDSIPTSLLHEAENNVIKLFNEIETAIELDNTFIDKLPMIFIRTRSHNQFLMFLDNSKLIGLCGFVLPKFDIYNGKKHLETLEIYNDKNNKNLYIMPILETSAVAFKEKRIEELIKIKYLLDSYKELVLNIRLGGTDLSGIFSLRRNRNCTIYDLSIISDCISDILNVFKRDEYIISGPVYEYFDVPQDLDSSPLVKEILLDKVNGLLGKTVIHPNQVNIVNSLYAVSKEDFLDAESIVNSISDGVIKSSYSNKMNEVKPHLKWAHEILLTSSIMGVLNDGKSYKDIIRYANNNSYRL